MFLHLSVILFTGWVSAPVQAGKHPPGIHLPGQTPSWADTPWVDTPWADTPWADTPSIDTILGRHPLGRQPPAQCMLGYTPPCPVHAEIDMATAVDGTHPTGMYSCYFFFLRASQNFFDVLALLFVTQKHISMGKFTCSKFH